MGRYNATAIRDDKSIRERSIMAHSEQTRKKVALKYKWHRFLGLCGKCGEEANGNPLCVKCKEIKAVYQKKAEVRKKLILKWRIYLGLCHNCGAEANGNLHCDRCQEKNNERQRATRLKRKNAGVCSCGQPLATGKNKCERCYQRKRKSNELLKYGAGGRTCRTDKCDGIPEYHQHFCNECLETLEAARQSCSVYFRKCGICETFFTTKYHWHIRCSECQDIRTHKLNTESRRERTGIELLTRTCAYYRCEETFYTYNKNKTTCSDLCSKRLMKRNENQRERVVRKAARSGSKHIEKVDLAVLFYRDNKRCQLCGKKLNLKRKVPHPMAATTDHIIALVEGGEHSYRNTQLACFMCNSLKGAGTWPGGEQLRMFG